MTVHEAFIIIFNVEDYGNHCGIYFRNVGFYDLSLAGNRKLDLSDSKFPRSRSSIYRLETRDYTNAIEFFDSPAILAPEIIEQERAEKGWHLRRKSGDFVLKLRTARSKSEESLNCVEWLLLGLESSGVIFPDNILTPQNLTTWCLSNLPVLVYDCDWT